MLLICLSMIMTTVSGAYGELVFDVDFRQDGIYETSWPLKVGEVISLDIYVSNVPAPGLRAMGFKMIYDSTKLQVIPGGTEVDAGNWIGDNIDLGTSGEIHMPGFRLGSGLSGDDIKLGTVRFQCKDPGISEIWLLDHPGTVHDFVLADEFGTVLDGDIGDGVLLAKIQPVIKGDISGNGVVDLGDVILVLKVMTGMKPANTHSKADVNGDGVIGLPEALFTLGKVAGTRN